MINTYQMPGMNMLQHGIMVKDFYNDIHGYLMGWAPLNNKWKLPKILEERGKEIALKALTSEEALEYLVFHDCGKSLCKTVDANGKQHFPNHARRSYEFWLECGGSEEIGWYILHDMDLHTSRGDELKEFLKDERIPTLMLAAWAEIHANCKVFGGMETTSFKIKWKHLEKITRWFFERNTV